jgi:hypothetical protein
VPGGIEGVERLALRVDAHDRLEPAHQAPAPARLFAFFYATLHLLTWIVLIHYFEVGEIITDVFKRPFITVGRAYS